MPRERLIFLRVAPIFNRRLASKNSLRRSVPFEAHFPRFLRHRCRFGFKSRRFIFKTTKLPRLATKEFFMSYWCPERDLNSHTVRQRLLRPSCLPFHHLGRYIFPMKFLSCTPLICRTVSRMLVFGGMAPIASQRSHIYISPPKQVCVSLVYRK